MRHYISVSYIVTILLLSGAQMAAVWAERRIPERLAIPLDKIDADLLGWTAVKDRELDSNVLHALAPTTYLSRQYRKGDSHLDLFIAFYAQQRAGESMHSPKHCLPGAGWEIWKHDSLSVPFNGKMVQINNYSIHNSGQRMLMLYWYQSRQRVIASEYVGKLLLARDTLLSGRTAASIVRISLPDTPGAREEASEFAAAMMTHLQRAFGE